MDSLTKDLWYVKGYKQALNDYAKMLQEYNKSNEMKFATESAKNKLQSKLEKTFFK